MTESLGLSIGVANLVAARGGSAPVSRRSVLTLFDQRPSEVGLPEENSNLTEPGLVVHGFIERIGDRAPVVAADGTSYLAEALTVEALEALARSVGYGSPVTIAVPAYWSPAQVSGLRDEFFAQPGLSANGVAPTLISDATAALTGLSTQRGFPTAGAVAVCDFGAGGTTITLAHPGPTFQQIATLRYTEFSGSGIDQLIANHLQAPPSECRRAKETLSAGTVATIPTGSGAGAPFSRADLEQLIARPVDLFLAAVEEALQRNGIQRGNLAAVAAVGGGASIPLLTARLSERLQVPVFNTPQPAVIAAIGAAQVGEQQASAGAATAMGPAVETPPELVTGPSTQLAQTELAPQAGGGGAKTGAQGGLAWSQDTSGDEPVPYTGPEIANEYGREPTGLEDATQDRFPAEPGGLPWYKRTALVLTVAGAIGGLLLLAVVLALTLGHDKSTPAPSQTVTVTLPNGDTSTSVIPAPPPSSTEAPPTTSDQPSTTSQSPSTTSSQPTTTTTTTTTQPSTTSQTTAPSSSQQTTTQTSRRPFEPPGRR
jgi:hypothetical protein